VKAFNLAVEGLHYEIAMSGIVRGGTPVYAGTNLANPRP
jgi:hypothetical protein